MIMKRILLNLNLLIAFTLFSAQEITAQNTVDVSASANWIGYANVFDLGGGFQFGSPWELGAIKSVLNTSANTVTLYPNYNTYNASDPYWANGAIGNKIFEGNTFVENNALAGQTLTFKGFVESNTIVEEYEVLAFIKGLNPNTGYSLDVFVSAPLVQGENFSITAENIPAGLVVQYGFSVTGLNANPAAEAANGNVVVTESILSVDSFERASIKVFPNPATTTLTVEALAILDSISVFNSLGQEVLQRNPQATSSLLDISGLQSGIYIVKTVSEGKVIISKVVKN